MARVDGRGRLVINSAVEGRQLVLRIDCKRDTDFWAEIVLSEDELRAAVLSIDNTAQIEAVLGETGHAACDLDARGQWTE